MSHLTDHSARLYAALQEQLTLAEQLPAPLLQRTDAAIRHCLDTLRALAEYFTNHPPAGQAEEISFFRHSKPPILAEFVYYTKIYQLHAHWPAGGAIAEQAHIGNALVQLQHFFEENREFYVYYRSGCTDRDECYFMRGRPDPRLFTGGICFNPADAFSTGYDTLLAHLLANDRMKQYLEKQLADTALGHPPAAAAQLAKHPAKWTDDIVGLVELAYAIVEKGSCNKGNATLIQVILALGTAFNIHIKDHSRYWIDICRRKSEKPSFIEKLLLCLKRRVDSTCN